MRANRLAVIEPLELQTVRLSGRRLHLWVTDNRCGHHLISFRCATKTIAAEYGPRLARWIEDRTPLAYVRGGTEGVLLEIEALLARAVS